MRKIILACVCLLLLIPAGSRAATIFNGTEEELKDAPIDLLDAGWRLYIQKGDIAGARIKFEEAAKQTPDNVLVLFALAVADMEQGRHAQGYQRCVKALEVCPWSPHLEIMLADAIELQRYARDIAPLQAILRKRLVNKDASWLEHSLVSLALARSMTRSSKIDDAVKLYEDQPFVRQWLVIGPFNNRDHGGFKNKGVVEEQLPTIDLQAGIPGRGRQVKWFKAGSNPSGCLNLSEIFYPGEESLGYACVYVKCEQDTSGTIVIGTGGANMVWVNGVKLATEELYHKWRPIQRLIPVSLQKGLNQILVKVADESKRMCALSMCVLRLPPTELAKAGSAVKAAKGFSYTIDPKEIAAFTPPKNDDNDDKVKPLTGLQGYDWGAMRFFDSILKEQPYNMLALIDRGYLNIIYGIDDKKWKRTRPLLDKAAKAWPKCSIAQEIAAMVQLGENEARALLEKAVASSEQAISAREAMLRKLLQGGFLHEAEKKARKLLEQHKSAVAWRIIGKIQQKRGWIPEARHAFSRALELAPGWGKVILEFANTFQDREQRLKIVSNGLQREFSLKLSSTVASSLEARQNFEKALTLRKQELRLLPYSSWSYTKVAVNQRSRGDLSDAIKTLEHAIERLPQSPGLLEKLGRFYLEAGEKEKGLAMMRSSLAIKSDNPKLADYLKQLEPKREKFYKEHDITFAELKGKDKTAKDFPRHNKLVLLDQGYVKVNTNGTQSTMIHSVTKVLRRRAIWQESYHSIPYDPTRQRVEVIIARVIQEDGTIIDNPRISDSSYGGRSGPSLMYSGSYRIKRIRLPQVKEGSIVEVQYTVEDTKENVYADEFEDDFFIGSPDPTIRFEYTANLPADMKVCHGQAGTDVKPVKVVKPGNRIEWTWKAQDLPGIEIEPRMPPQNELVPPLRLSSFTDWNAVGKWIWNLSKEQMELPEDIKQKAADLVKDCKTREEKIAAIYYFIISKIHYVSISYGKFGCKPHKAERTFRASYGDCKDTAVLFCAMLGAVGVDARFTLVRTYGLGRERTGIPGKGLFNHAIAYVPPLEKGGKHYWLDGTTDYFSFGEIPSSDRDTLALVVGPDSVQRLTIDPDRAEFNTITQQMTIKLLPGGKGELVTREARTGQFAPGLRRAFEKPENIKLGLKRFLQSRFPGSQLRDFKYSGTDIKKPETWLSFKIDAPALAKKEGQNMRINPAISPSMLSRIYTPQRKRVHDMIIGIPYKQEKATRLILPAGATIISMPKELFIDKSFGSFNRKLHKTENGVKITITLTLKVRRLPAKDYQAFKEFCNTVDNAAEEYIVYSDNSPTAQAAGRKNADKDKAAEKQEAEEETAE